MVLLVDSPDLKSVTLVTLEAIKLESYFIALFPPLDWPWTILPQNLKEQVLTKKHLVPVVLLIRDYLGNGVRLTSSFPSSDLGKITSFNLFLPSCLTLISSVFIGCLSYVLINTLYPILINALYPIIIYTLPYYPNNVHYTLLPDTHSCPHTVVVQLARSTGSSQSWQRICFL